VIGLAYKLDRCEASRWLVDDRCLLVFAPNPLDRKSNPMTQAASI